MCLIRAKTGQLENNRVPIVGLCRSLGIVQGAVLAESKHGCTKIRRIAAFEMLRQTPQDAKGR